jgi:hypothetical protein
MAKVGRPRTTIDKLPHDWKEKLFAAANEGASKLEMMVAVGIGDSAWDTLQEDSEEFRLSVQRAKNLSQIWWEKKGRELTENGSAVTWKFNMQNRFGWSEKNDTTLSGPGGNPIQIQEVKLTIVDPAN